MTLDLSRIRPQCPSAVTADKALLCDSERGAMIRELRRIGALVESLQAELVHVKYWRDYWKSEVDALQIKLADALGAR